MALKDTYISEENEVISLLQKAKDLRRDHYKEEASLLAKEVYTIAKEEGFHQIALEAGLILLWAETYDKKGDNFRRYKDLCFTLCENNNKVVQAEILRHEVSRMVQMSCIGEKKAEKIHHILEELEQLYTVTKSKSVYRDFYLSQLYYYSHIGDYNRVLSLMKEFDTKHIDNKLVDKEQNCFFLLNTFLMKREFPKAYEYVKNYLESASIRGRNYFLFCESYLLSSLFVDQTESAYKAYEEVLNYGDDILSPLDKERWSIYNCYLKLLGGEIAFDAFFPSYEDKNSKMYLAVLSVYSLDVLFAKSERKEFVLQRLQAYMTSNSFTHRNGRDEIFGNLLISILENPSILSAPTTSFAKGVKLLCDTSRKEGMFTDNEIMPYENFIWLIADKFYKDTAKEEWTRDSFFQFITGSIPQ